MNFDELYDKIQNLRGNYMESVEFKKVPLKNFPKYTDYVSNISIDSVDIKLSVTRELGEDKLKEYGIHLEKDVKILKSNYEKTLQEEFNDLLTKAEDWETPAKTVDELMKLAGKPETIEYSYYSSDKESKFDIWFNSRAPFNSKFFGGHSCIITMTIKNGKIKGTSNSIEG